MKNDFIDAVNKCHTNVGTLQRAEDPDIRPIAINPSRNLKGKYLCSMVKISLKHALKNAPLLLHCSLRSLIDDKLTSYDF